MDRLWRYYSNVQSVRGRMTGLPAWARALMMIAALPGIAAIALSILALLVSILALLLLTVPLYRLLTVLTGTGERIETAGSVEVVGGAFPGDLFRGGFSTLGTPGRKRVDATVTDPADDDRATTPGAERSHE